MPNLVRVSYAIVFINVCILLPMVDDLVTVGHSQWRFQGTGRKTEALTPRIIDILPSMPRMANF